MKRISNRGIPEAGFGKNNRTSAAGYSRCASAKGWIALDGLRYARQSVGLKYPGTKE
jgi:hypothetical protein